MGRQNGSSDWGDAINLGALRLRAARSAQDDCRSVVRSSYQTRQLLAGTMGAGFLQLKAEEKPGWFTMTPSTRNWSGECGSVRTCWRIASGREFSQ